MTIREAIENGSAVLDRSGIPEPIREARSLLAFAADVSIARLYAHPDSGLSVSAMAKYQECLRRRAGREPFQYIVGCQEFYGLEFVISPAVLIPRPETEMLVEEAIVRLAPVRQPRFCEIGSGSGAISLAILSAVKDAYAVAADISSETLAIARENAERHGLSAHIEFLVSDVFGSIAAAGFDLVVSNPPYVPAAEWSHLQREVRDFEPRIAVTDGDDGLSVIRRIVAGAPERLRSGGTLLLEFGFGQADRVAELFGYTIWQNVELRQDLNGIPRIVIATVK